jgi:hypothetical protein
MDDDRKKKGDGNQSKSQWISGQQFQKSHLGYPTIWRLSSQPLHQTFFWPVQPIEEQDVLYNHDFNLTIYGGINKDDEMGE